MLTITFSQLELDALAAKLGEDRHLDALLEHGPDVVAALDAAIEKVMTTQAMAYE